MSFCFLNRKASFDQSFNEEGEFSATVKYVFPEGCESPLLERETQEIPPIEVKGTEIEIPETTTTLPETTMEPEPVIAFEEPTCPDVCCDNDRPQILLPKAKSDCQKTARIVIPINMEIIEQIPISDITEISNESNPSIMLLKLLRLVEKCRMM